MTRVVTYTLLIATLITLTVMSEASLSKQPNNKGLDTKAIEQKMGKAGESKGDVYKIALPRTDLKVSVADLELKPGLALGSWVAFKQTEHGAVAHGDLVLTEDEVFPVIQELEEHGILITGLHNHLIGESPRIMYLHFLGQGEAGKLADALKQALGKTKTPFEASHQTSAHDGELAVESIQTHLGQKGELKNGVLKFSSPRSEKVREGGMEFPPSMGMATVINFQSAGDGQVAATGDFVMTDKKVNRVARALEQNGIKITALHNHLLHGSPDLYFMHFWAQGPTETVTKGLKAGLDALKRG